MVIESVTYFIFIIHAWKGVFGLLKLEYVFTENNDTNPDDVKVNLFAKSRK